MRCGPFEAFFEVDMSFLVQIGKIEIVFLFKNRVYKSEEIHLSNYKDVTNIESNFEIFKFKILFFYSLQYLTDHLLPIRILQSP